MNARELMLPEVPRATARETALDCRARLSTATEVGVIAVVDDDQLLGLVPARRLLVAADDAPLSSLFEPHLAVSPDDPIEAVAHEIARANPVAVAVVSDAGALLGVVDPRRVVAALVAEHDEDLARLGGYRSSASRARAAAEEPLARRLWHRLPWLLVGLGGAMASALIVGAFEEELNQVVLLAFFVPAVVYMADSVGTQTETLLIRALAGKVDLRTVVRRELLTGLVLGLSVAALFYPFALIGWGDAEVALGVSLALLCSCSIATTVAMALPIGLNRLGLDPAFGSGPLATVIQDLLSIAIYFAIAVPLAT